VTSAIGQAILLTPPGAAAIAVVRIVGPTVPAFLASHFSRTGPLGRAVHGELRDGERVIDDPVVVRVRDDVADLNLHGGVWVVRSTLDLLAREGFQEIQLQSETPLPDMAVDPDNPLEREVLNYLPLARTERAVRMLLAQPQAWLALLTQPRRPEDVERILADRTMQRLLFPPRVAIVGAANVGKSTLANQLFGQERSLTADMPGTTRDWVGELADIDGLAVMLVDTPGIRPTEDPIERQAIAISHAQAEAAEVIVVVLDATRPLDDEQLAPIARYPDSILVVNKTDESAVFDYGTLRSHDPLLIAARSGQGLPELKARILRHLGCENQEIDRPLCWTDRQREFVRRSMSDPGATAWYSKPW
jgi:tRNA modification GTPase